jgi:hypothetical protein
MKVSSEKLLKGLNIVKIGIEPEFKDVNFFLFRNQEWSWEDGAEFGLKCHLEVYAKEDYSFDTYINNIVVMDNECNLIELTSSQIERLKSEIIESIEILTLQA